MRRSGFTYNLFWCLLMVIGVELSFVIPNRVLAFVQCAVCSVSFVLHAVIMIAEFREK